MLGAGLLEYLMTFGMVLAFTGTIVFGVGARRSFSNEVSSLKVSRRHIFAALAILAIFIMFEQAVVYPTQQLFFDDAIYQGMAVDMIHTGQAWMCDYGTPAHCISGEVFHEPIGEAFNLAIGFVVLGVHRSSAYATGFALSAASVLLTFFTALLLFRDKLAALFSELLIAMSPVLLVWARPTSSDVAMLAYSLLAVMAMLLFIRRKNIWTFGFALFSAVLVAYMKVDAIAYVILIGIMYVLLDGKSIASSVSENLKRIRRNVLNTKMLIVILIVLVAITPEAAYVVHEHYTGNYGSTGTYVQETCGSAIRSIEAGSNSFGINYFGANVCDNVLFWFDRLRDMQVVQPAIFTIIGIAGTAVAAVYKRYRRQALALGIWFLVFFIMYTAFYAGGANYGVDWRFMLSMIAQIGMFGGLALSMLFGLFTRLGRHFNAERIAGFAGMAAILALVAYPVAGALPVLHVKPAQIQQAGGARFYEGFIYNNSASIPDGCLVFSYDPTLFNINGLASTQFSNLYSTKAMEMYRGEYSCLVIDVGYWCGTPDGNCYTILNSTKTETIASAAYPRTGFTYGLYRIIG